MRIYDKLTESPERLGAFLKSLPVLDAPWDREFQKTFCAECKAENCDECKNGQYRNNPEWWLEQETRKGEERDIRICQICNNEFDREDMDFTRDCHGIAFRLVCYQCWKELMEKGYDGEYYTEAEEQIKDDY